MEEVDNTFVEEKQKPNFKKIIIIITSIILILLLIIVYARYKATSGIIVKEYKISDQALPENFHGTKIVQISDIYFGNTTNIKSLEKISKKINELNTDIVIFTGDLTDKELNQETKTKLIETLKTINAKLGKYQILGDIDKAESDNILTQSNFINLNNTKKYIYYNNSTPIEITNIDEQTENYNIYITHKPDEIDNLNNNHNLILAGHTLGGQLNIPLIKNLLLQDGAKKYNKDYYKEKNLYISSGIGTTNFKYRFLNKPSINLYRLTK